MNLKNIKGNKSVTREQILCNFTYIRYPEKVNLERQKIDEKLPEAMGRGRLGELVFNEYSSV